MYTKPKRNLIQWVKDNLTIAQSHRASHDCNTVYPELIAPSTKGTEHGGGDSIQIGLYLKPTKKSYLDFQSKLNSKKCSVHTSLIKKVYQ